MMVHKGDRVLLKTKEELMALPNSSKDTSGNMIVEGLFVPVEMQSLLGTEIVISSISARNSTKFRSRAWCFKLCFISKVVEAVPITFTQSVS